MSGILSFLTQVVLYTKCFIFAKKIEALGVKKIISLGLCLDTMSNTQNKHKKNCAHIIKENKCFELRTLCKKS